MPDGVSPAVAQQTARQAQRQTAAGRTPPVAAMSRVPWWTNRLSPPQREDYIATWAPAHTR